GCLVEVCAKEGGVVCRCDGARGCLVADVSAAPDGERDELGGALDALDPPRPVEETDGRTQVDDGGIVALADVREVAGGERSCERRLLCLERLPRDHGAAGGGPAPFAPPQGAAPRRGVRRA